jgi:hypothetical protein
MYEIPAEIVDLSKIRVTCPSEVTHVQNRFPVCMSLLLLLLTSLKLLVVVTRIDLVLTSRRHRFL